MNKRDFIVGACTTMAAGLGQTTTHTTGSTSSCSGARANARLSRRPDLLTNPGLAQWQRYAGDAFTNVQTEEQLTLREVEQRHAELPGEQFTLVFTARNGADSWPGGLTTVTHTETGQQLVLSLRAAGSNTAADIVWRAEFSRLT